MKTSRRGILHVLGLAAFSLITAFAVYRAPPELGRISLPWLIAGFVFAAAATMVQGLQMRLFLRQEGARMGQAWALWFVAEKAWLNSLFPAKAGTAAGVVVLQKRLGLRWTGYLRFMMLCAATALIASIGILMVLLTRTSPWLPWLAAPTVVLLLALCKPIYRIGWASLYALGLLSLVSLAMLSCGVAACLLGLGHGVNVTDVAAIGVTMNAMSIASITPGNFGVREIALSLLAPLLTLEFGVVVQGAVCYVVLRLLAALALATVLRAVAWPEGAASDGSSATSDDGMRSGRRGQQKP